MSLQQSDLSDPALVAEVDLARAAAQEEAGDERVGAYVEYQLEDEAAVTHLFEADKPSYQGWRWAVTITSAGPDTDVTVSEAVLLPGPTALVAPEWIPWQNRVQAGDLGVGDLFPTAPDDPRLAPAYLQSDDPAVEEVATEAGLGRVRVMSRPARLDAADRWLQSEFGPRSDMARGAPAHCGTCGFYLPLAGSLKAAFGTCGNEISPADGHVVHTEYGCGAHSEAEVEQVSPVLVADLIYDDAQLDVEPLAVVDEVPADAASPEEPLSGPETSPAEPTDSAEGPAVTAPETSPTSADTSSAVDAEPSRPDAEASVDASPDSEAALTDPDAASSDSANEPLATEAPAATNADTSADSSAVDAGQPIDPAPDDAPGPVATDPPTPEPPATAAQGETPPAADLSSPEPVSEVEPSAPAAAPEPKDGPEADAVEAPPAVEPSASADSPESAGAPDSQAGPAAAETDSESAGPAGIEPIVTSETSGPDDSTHRE